MKFQSRTIPQVEAAVPLPKLTHAEATNDRIKAESYLSTSALQSPLTVQSLGLSEVPTSRSRAAIGTKNDQQAFMSSNIDLAWISTWLQQFDEHLPKLSDSAGLVEVELYNSSSSTLQTFDSSLTFPNSPKNLRT
jgi:hypothetical protein